MSLHILKRNPEINYDIWFANLSVWGFEQIFSNSKVKCLRGLKVIVLLEK